MGDREQAVARHSDQNVTVLAVVTAQIVPGHGKDIVKGEPSDVEAHAVSSKVLGRFCVVPFEIVVFHIYYGQPVYSRLRASAFSARRTSPRPPRCRPGRARSPR